MLRVDHNITLKLF